MSPLNKFFGDIIYYDFLFVITGGSGGSYCNPFIIITEFIPDRITHIYFNSEN